mmetsp:Transcript_23032/g.54373  ORF Transcript_23032/g.54373 Transcript_23032/m.54373 type:complete len:317 (-) Transcript_23032:60-1010(-)
MSSHSFMLRHHTFSHPRCLRPRRRRHHGTRRRRHGQASSAGEDGEQVGSSLCCGTVRRGRYRASHPSIVVGSGDPLGRHAPALQEEDNRLSTVGLGRCFRQSTFGDSQGKTQVRHWRPTVTPTSRGAALSRWLSAATGHRDRTQLRHNKDLYLLCTKPPSGGSHIAAVILVHGHSPTNPPPSRRAPRSCLPYGRRYELGGIRHSRNGRIADVGPGVARNSLRCDVGRSWSRPLGHSPYVRHTSANGRCNSHRTSYSKRTRLLRRSCAPERSQTAEQTAEQESGSLTRHIPHIISNKILLVTANKIHVRPSDGRLQA